MIPKIVHYCWFGGKEKPEQIQKCIESWHEHLVGYKFIEWNEATFDVDFNQYTKQAYESKKYAFVSDVARIIALQQYGGIYMDTDVEVLKPLDSILEYPCVLGFEVKNFVATSFMACQPNHPLINLFINEYNGIQFYNQDGSINFSTNVTKLTDILTKKGLIRNNKKQYLEDGIVVFPKEYFSPYDYINCNLETTGNSYCIHYYYVSWMPLKTQLKKKIKSIVVKIIGSEKLNSIRNIVKK